MRCEGDTVQQVSQVDDGDRDQHDQSRRPYGDQANRDKLSAAGEEQQGQRLGFNRWNPDANGERTKDGSERRHAEHKRQLIANTFQESASADRVACLFLHGNQERRYAAMSFVEAIRESTCVRS